MRSPLPIMLERKLIARLILRTPRPLALAKCTALGDDGAEAVDMPSTDSDAHSEAESL